MRKKLASGKGYAKLGHASIAPRLILIMRPASTKRKVKHMAATQPAAPKNKGEAAEKAIARLFGQMDKNVSKRQWTPATYAALICYAAEATGAKFPTPEARKAFREIMADSDFSFSSNFKKYAVSRGFLPKADEYAEANLE